MLPIHILFSDNIYYVENRKRNEIYKWIGELTYYVHIIFSLGIGVM